MSDTRPNLLLITTDQQRWDALHAAGNGSIFTPHLNWLSDTGVRFDRAYSDCPICMPARATIMTGLPAYRHGAVSNACGEPIRGRSTLPERLTRAGYETRAQGKMHFHPMRKKYGFETMELTYDYYRERRRRGEAASGLHGMGQNEMEPVLEASAEGERLTDWAVNRSIDFLETRDAERPFFLWTSISKPHPPLDPSPRFWDLYREMPMPPPFAGAWSERMAREGASYYAPTASLNKANRFSEAQLRSVRRAYHACVTEIDVALGRLFARLREMGLLENTLIVFTSDHGEMLGDHGMGAKSTFFEGAAHIPMLARPPGEQDADPRRGTRCDEIVTPADLLPTFLSAAGLEDGVPDGAEGHDLLALAGGASGRSRFVGQAGLVPGHHNFAVMEGPWKYICTNAEGEELLFRLDDDPGETVDRSADDPERRRAMHAALVETLAQAGSDQVAGDDIVRGPAPRLSDVGRFRAWPGFHSDAVESDFLH